MPAIKKGMEVELNVERLAFGAGGVARIDGFVVFVDRALPGQRVKAKIIRKKKDYAFARITEILQESPHRVTPRCRHFPDCGGCAFQHLEYEQQLRAKETQVLDLLQRIGGFEHPPVAPARRSPDLFFYRNKMEYTFSDRRWLSRQEIDSGEPIEQRDFALGLHVRGRFDRIIAIQQCYLQSETGDALRNFVADWVLQESSLRPYTTRDHSGFWRFLVLREGKNTGETMVNVVTADGGEAGNREVERLAEEMVKAFPELTTFIHTINRKKAQVATGEMGRVLHGPGYIYETLGRWRFRISPESFFQTNTRAAELLYDTVAELAAPTGGEVLYDLYCGAGTIGIYLSDRVGKIVGVELVEEAIADARVNAALNGIEHAEWIAADLKELLTRDREFFRRYGHPDVVVVDPPRAGVHPKVVQMLAKLAPPRIVYVSCNPSTFARDAAMLAPSGYRLQKVVPVDMFPHTAHIETVSLLIREGE